jgi:hypothetical protein
MCRAMNVTTRIPATHAIVVLMLTACVLLLGACASTSSQPQTPQQPQAAPSEDEVYHLALHWSRNSADFQQIVKVAGDQIAVENILHLQYRALERSEALGRRSVEHDADHHERAKPHAAGSISARTPVM